LNVDKSGEVADAGATAMSGSDAVARKARAVLNVFFIFLLLNCLFSLRDNPIGVLISA
jgi:hypothetical protein